MKVNFVKFSREPVKIYVGQRFFIKLNFSESAQRLHQVSDKMSENEFVEVRKDVDNKKYFNCVSHLTVSKMPTA